jgi:hypothetical protein
MTCAVERTVDLAREWPRRFVIACALDGIWNFRHAPQATQSGDAAASASTA